MICRWLLFCAVVLCSGCYSLKGISIPATISTFYIDQFQNSVSNAPPDVGQRFSEEFRDVVLQNTRLTYDEQIPDIEFTGAISSFTVQSVAPERSTDGDVVSFGSSLNRLNISVRVEYVNNLDVDDAWKQSFSFFQDFENDQDLAQVQDDLIEEIFDQILQDIFTKAFTNW
ncbi:MAG: LPS assembly lipoprotein LptE [Bacteroidota bacterium]